MKYSSVIIWMLFFAAVLTGCKKPYVPAAVNSLNSYLVVEGVINIGTDSTLIKLSRTVNISSVVTTNLVAGAHLTVESNQGDSYPLTEAKKGNYTAVGLNLSTAKKYRLNIKTADDQQYLSDFVAAQVTPPIDSIGSMITNSGLQLYTNTHDPDNSTHYYRWDFTETWQFHAKYLSEYITDGKEILHRSANKSIYSCFASDTSSSILLGSSAKLAKDMIYQQPIVFIPSTAEKIETKYSILLKQYALSAEAYNFWVNLKKNTEQLGSIFDAQPSNINGNIHNISNLSEVVIGYISVSSIQTKRIFIASNQLPSTWKAVYPYDCQIDSVSDKFVARDLIPLNSLIIPLERYIVITEKGTESGYLSSHNICVDCTLRGNQTQPVFWK